MRSNKFGIKQNERARLKSNVSSDHAFAVFNQIEAAKKNQPVAVSTFLLVGAECPFSCNMCDLWKYTLNSNTPLGTIPKQIEVGLQTITPGQWVKLYNASNFFDPRSIPTDDLAAIASLCNGFQRIIVENHPRLLSENVTIFRDSLKGRLEIAMGLETLHEPSFQLLNKGMAIQDYVNACRTLIQQQIDIRTFVMLQPPGTPTSESIDWTRKSVEFAFQNGSRHVSIIPTRTGNGWIESLIKQGSYKLPSARQLEEAFIHSIELAREMDKIVTVDLWDWDQLSGHCEHCMHPRKKRLESSNLAQAWLGNLDLYRDPNCGSDCACEKANRNSQP